MVLLTHPTLASFLETELQAKQMCWCLLKRAIQKAGVGRSTANNAGCSFTMSWLLIFHDISPADTYSFHGSWVIKNLSAIQETRQEPWVWSLGQGRSLGEGNISTYSEYPKHSQVNYIWLSLLDSRNSATVIDLQPLQMPLHSLAVKEQAAKKSSTNQNQIKLGNCL